GVTIDTFGWFGADVETFTIFKVLGILFLMLGIILMNYVRSNPKDKKMNKQVYIWIIISRIFGICRQIQNAHISSLVQKLHSSNLASLISFAIDTITLFILTLLFNRTLKMTAYNQHKGKLKPIYFIGGVLGVIFVTTNIILMPHLGAALTTIIVMLGQMLM